MSLFPNFISISLYFLYSYRERQRFESVNCGTDGYCGVYEHSVWTGYVWSGTVWTGTVCYNPICQGPTSSRMLCDTGVTWSRWRKKKSWRDTPFILLLFNILSRSTNKRSQNNRRHHHLIETHQSNFTRLRSIHKQYLFQLPAASHKELFWVQFYFLCSLTETHLFQKRPFFFPTVSYIWKHSRHIKNRTKMLLNMRDNFWRSIATEEDYFHRAILNYTFHRNFNLEKAIWHHKTLRQFQTSLNL